MKSRKNIRNKNINFKMTKKNNRHSLITMKKNIHKGGSGIFGIFSREKKTSKEKIKDILILLLKIDVEVLKANKFLNNEELITILNKFYEKIKEKPHFKEKFHQHINLFSSKNYKVQVLTKDIKEYKIKLEQIPVVIYDNIKLHNKDINKILDKKDQEKDKRTVNNILFLDHETTKLIKVFSLNNDETLIVSSDNSERILPKPEFRPNKTFLNNDAIGDKQKTENEVVDFREYYNRHKGDSKELSFIYQLLYFSLLVYINTEASKTQPINTNKILSDIYKKIKTKSLQKEDTSDYYNGAYTDLETFYNDLYTSTTSSTSLKFCKLRTSKIAISMLGRTNCNNKNILDIVKYIIIKIYNSELNKQFTQKEFNLLFEKVDIKEEPYLRLKPDVHTVLLKETTEDCCKFYGNSCSAPKKNNSDYCVKHSCNELNCTSRIDPILIEKFCKKHRCEKHSDKLIYKYTHNKYNLCFDCYMNEICNYKNCKRKKDKTNNYCKKHKCQECQECEELIYKYYAKAVDPGKKIPDDLKEHKYCLKHYKEKVCHYKGCKKLIPTTTLKVPPTTDLEEEPQIYCLDHRCYFGNTYKYNGCKRLKVKGSSFCLKHICQWDNECSYVKEINDSLEKNRNKIKLIENGFECQEHKQYDIKKLTLTDEQVFKNIITDIKAARAPARAPARAARENKKETKITTQDISEPTKVHIATSVEAQNVSTINEKLYPPTEEEQKIALARVKKEEEEQAQAAAAQVAPAPVPVTPAPARAVTTPVPAPVEKEQYQAEALYDSIELQNIYGDNLNFKKGDLISIVKENVDGWYKGYLINSDGTREVGMIPRNYIKKTETVSVEKATKEEAEAEVAEPQAARTEAKDAAPAVEPAAVATEKVYIIFAMGPSASGKTTGIKNTLIDLLQKQVNKDIKTVFTIDGGDMRDASCFYKNKLDRYCKTPDEKAAEKAAKAAKAVAATNQVAVNKVAGSRNSHLGGANPENEYDKDKCLSIYNKNFEGVKNRMSGPLLEKIIEKSISKEQNTVKEKKCLWFKYNSEYDKATIQDEMKDEMYLDRIFYESIKQKKNPKKEKKKKK